MRRSALTEAGQRVRVVSMPCTAVFDAQPQHTATACCRRACRASPSRPACATAGGATSAAGGAVVGIDSFGASAPAKKLFEHFGFTPENVVRTVEGLL